MTEQDLFTIVGIREEAPKPVQKVRRMAGFPWISVILLGLIVLCCLFAEVLMTKDPLYLDLKNFNMAPNSEFLFGTDTLGRDIEVFEVEVQGIFCHQYFCKQAAKDD